MSEEWGSKELIDNLRYDPKSGRIFRRFGGEVFTSKDRGYRKARLGNRTWYAHRVAWLLHYGDWPCHEVDHIDGDRSNNRIDNLRDVTPRVNCRNKAISRRSASGITGIYRVAKPACWVPQVSIGNKSKSLGSTPCLGVAIRRRKRAEKELGFHENHGRLSNG